MLPYLAAIFDKGGGLGRQGICQTLACAAMMRIYPAMEKAEVVTGQRVEEVEVEAEGAGSGKQGTLGTELHHRRPRRGETGVSHVIDTHFGSANCSF